MNRSVTSAVGRNSHTRKDSCMSEGGASGERPCLAGLHDMSQEQHILTAGEAWELPWSLPYVFLPLADYVVSEELACSK